MTEPMDPKNITRIDQTPAVDAEVEKINVSLNKPWGDTELARGRNIGISMHFEVRQAVVRRFTAKGWDVKFTDDQRDGSFLSFKPTGYA